MYHATFNTARFRPPLPPGLMPLIYIFMHAFASLPKPNIFNASIMISGIWVAMVRPRPYRYALSVPIPYAWSTRESRRVAFRLHFISGHITRFDVRSPRYEDIDADRHTLSLLPVTKSIISRSLPSRHGRTEAMHIFSSLYYILR